MARRNGTGKEDPKCEYNGDSGYHPVISGLYKEKCPNCGRMVCRQLISGPCCSYCEEIE